MFPLFAFQVLEPLRWAFCTHTHDWYEKQSCLQKKLLEATLGGRSSDPIERVTRHHCGEKNLGPCMNMSWLLRRHPHDWTNKSLKLEKNCLLQTQRSEGERGLVNKASLAICWHRTQLNELSHNEEVINVCGNNEIMSLKWMKNDLRCQLERLCTCVDSTRS